MIIADAAASRHKRVFVIESVSKTNRISVRLAGGALALNAGLAALLLQGCARFKPEPLSPEKNAERLEERSLTNASLRYFIETNSKHEFARWPVESWDFEALTFAAFYYHPSLAVARAQWETARGGEKTAAQRPNPVLSVTPAYNATLLTPSPWLTTASIDVPLETAGKRKYRRAQAAHLSEAARLNIASVAWTVRSALRANLIDYSVAEQRLEAIKRIVSLEQQVVKLLTGQIEVGSLSSAEAVTFRIALLRSKLDLTDAERLLSDARTRVAEALGVPLRSLDGVRLNFELKLNQQEAQQLTSAEARRAALLSRADILGALAEYAAAQSALQLEIARQYPDIHISPGYEYDQGSSKWSLGATLELPILSRNQGPIAEATAKRRESAAKFNALQTKVMTDVDRAVELYRITAQNLDALRALGAEQSKRQQMIEQQLKAGAVEPLELVNARVEMATTELAQLDGQLRLQQALGALEDALQRPLDSMRAVLEPVEKNRP